MLEAVVAIGLEVREPEVGRWKTRSPHVGHDQPVIGHLVLGIVDVREGVAPCQAVEESHKKKSFMPSFAFTTCLAWRYAFPDINYTEDKMPNYGLIVSYMRGTRLPPPDLWARELQGQLLPTASSITALQCLAGSYASGLA